MEAANKGAHEGGGLSIGCNIELPSRAGDSNEYVNLSDRLPLLLRAQDHVRQVLRRHSWSFPGGFGTLDELFESLTLIQTEKIERFPVVLYGTEYWSGLLDWVRATMVSEGALSEDELALIELTDDPVEACELVVRGLR